MNDKEIIVKLMEGQFNENRESKIDGFALIGIINNPSEKMFEDGYSFSEDEDINYGFDGNNEKPVFEITFNLVSVKKFYELIHSNEKEIKLIDIDVQRRPWVAIRDKKA